MDLAGPSAGLGLPPARPMVGSKARAVAVLFGGWFRVGHNADNLREFLLRPLAADVHMALTYRDDDGCDSMTSCGLHQRYAGLPRVVQLHAERQRTAGEFAAVLERSRYWPTIWRAYNTSAKCSRHTPRSNASSPYVCHGIKEGGNSFLAPVLGNPRLHVLHELLAQSRLHQLVRVFESRHGFRYAHSWSDVATALPPPMLTCADRPPPW